MNTTTQNITALKVAEYISYATDQLGNYYRFVCSYFPTECYQTPTCEDVLKQIFNISSLKTHNNTVTTNYQIGSYDCGFTVRGDTCGQSVTAYCSNESTLETPKILNILSSATNQCDADIADVALFHKVTAIIAGVMVGAMVLMAICAMIEKITAKCSGTKTVSNTRATERQGPLSSLNNLASSIYQSNLSSATAPSVEMAALLRSDNEVPTT